MKNAITSVVLIQIEHPEIMTQGETLEELEENMKDAYILMTMEDVPDNRDIKERILNGGERFTLVSKKIPKSPFDIPGIKTKATTKDILEAIRDSRESMAGQDASGVE